MRLPRTPETGSLPPREYWLIDPAKEKLDTPVDERGLIKTDELIKNVKAVFDPEWDWNVQDRKDVHHLYWYKKLYPNLADSHTVNPNYFRNLPINKALFTRIFHNSMHLVTHPSPVPSVETMGLTIETFRVTKSLFLAAQNTIKNEHAEVFPGRSFKLDPHFDRIEYRKEDSIDLEFMQEVMVRNFEGYESHFRAAQNIPPELRLVDMSESEDAIKTLFIRLGKIVLPPKAQNSVPQSL